MSNVHSERESFWCAYSRLLRGYRASRPRFGARGGDLHLNYLAIWNVRPTDGSGLQ